MTPTITLEPRVARDPRRNHEHEIIEGHLHQLVQFHHCHHDCFHPRPIVGWLSALALLNPEAEAWLAGLREKVAALRYLEWGRFWCCGPVAGGALG